MMERGEPDVHEFQIGLRNGLRLNKMDKAARSLVDGGAEDWAQRTIVMKKHTKHGVLH